MTYDNEKLAREDKDREPLNAIDGYAIQKTAETWIECGGDDIGVMLCAKDIARAVRELMEK